MILVSSCSGELGQYASTCECLQHSPVLSSPQTAGTGYTRLFHLRHGWARGLRGCPLMRSIDLECGGSLSLLGCNCGSNRTLIRPTDVLDLGLWCVAPYLYPPCLTRGRSIYNVPAGGLGVREQLFIEKLRRCRCYLTMINDGPVTWACGGNRRIGWPC